MVERENWGELRDLLRGYNSRTLSELCYILGLYRSGTIARKIQNILDSEYGFAYVNERLNFLIFGLELIDHVSANDLNSIVREHTLARRRRKWDKMVEIVRSEEVTPRELLGPLSIEELGFLYYNLFETEPTQNREGLTREVIKAFDLKWLEETMDSGFIMMAMGRGIELERTYEVVKDECKRADINAVRIDEIASSGVITEEVLEMIDESEYLFVDLTHDRPNVYYELGYCHGLGKSSENIVLMAKKGTKLHFDVRNMRTIMYQDHGKLRKELRKRLKALKG
ncbi:MAG: hypothetical protein V3U09_01235 [Thermoplasmata archaeon]